MSYDVNKREISQDLYGELLYRMIKINRFEERLMHLYNEGMVHGTLHLCVGEEASVVGSTAALKTEDYIFTTHRGHGECIGKGTDINLMMAEILGRSGGTNKGIGGSMHITQPEIGVVGSNGVVGASVPISLGAALTIKLKKIPDRVSVCFFGDGAANQGAVLESMNLAGAWKLPVIFVLIENQFAVSTPPKKASADPDFVKRAMPFGLKPFEVDGNDVLKVLYTVAKAREYVINGGGPCLVVEHTYRVSGHSKSDTNSYRSEDEIRHWTERNPIDRYSKYLLDEGIMNKEEIDAVTLNAEKAVEEAEKFAVSQPEADMTKAELEKLVYAD
ncbi:MAG: thiamine pyrophosphate-dependent dehydrogenase E1 component subunit alpha [Lachnospiraceae bacterium]|nr:thiamine pyrophosphate-dependent dehydrogenase E1 component subunit alpha [Lachnospiraceae bacterium]